jgi:4'-phosphopantetheinyl transferase
MATLVSAPAFGLSAPTERTALRSPAAGVVHLYTGDLDAEPADGSVLSDDECERAARFRFDRDRRRFVAGRSALRSLIASYLEIAPDEVAFAYGPQGKPFVSGSTLSFNVSHSGNRAIYAFASSVEIGVDVEVLDHAAYGDGVAERFFSPLEVATLEAFEPGARSDAFLRCWTRKEAFIKARGEGLSLPLHEFDVAFAPGTPPRILRTAWSATEPAEWTLCDISGLCPGAIAALAVRSTEADAVFKRGDLVIIERSKP